MLCCTVIKRPLCSNPHTFFSFMLHSIVPSIFFAQIRLQAAREAHFLARPTGILLLTSVGLAFGGNTMLSMPQRSKLVDGDFSLCN